MGRILGEAEGEPTMTWKPIRLLGVCVLAILLVVIGLFGLGPTLEAQGNFSAQIQLALRNFLASANTWTGTQTFDDIVVTGTCTGCGGGGGGIGGSIADGQIAVGSGADTISGSSAFTFVDGNTTIVLTPTQTIVTGTVTGGAGWTETSPGEWTHTPGDTEPLTFTFGAPLTNNQRYYVHYVQSLTTGANEVEIVGAGIPSFTRDDWDSVNDEAWFFAIDDATVLTFTPSSDYDGVITFGADATLVAYLPITPFITVDAAGELLPFAFGYDNVDGGQLTLQFEEPDGNLPWTWGRETIAVSKPEDDNQIQFGPWGFLSSNVAQTATAWLAPGRVEFVPETTGDPVLFLDGQDYLRGDASSVFLGTGAGTAWTGSRPTGNVGIGYYALESLTTGTNNIAIGYHPMGVLTEGASNISVGYAAGYFLTTGSENVYIGDSAGHGDGDIQAVTGDANVGIGIGSLGGNTLTSGSNNMAVGKSALGQLTTGSSNAAFGFHAGRTLTTGSNNLTAGTAAGEGQLTTGSYNTILGYQAGSEVNSGPKTGAQNVLIGYAARFVGALDDWSNAIAIGAEASVGASNTAVIGNSSVTDVYFGSVTGAAAVHTSGLFGLGVTACPSGQSATVTFGTDDTGEVIATRGSCS